MTDEKLIPSGVASGFIRDSIIRSLQACRIWNIHGPAVLSAALLNIGEFKFAYHGRSFFPNKNSADRPDLILPETWVERIEAIIDPDVVARAILDMLWQSFDFERCYFYDDQGKWNPNS